MLASLWLLSYWARREVIRASTRHFRLSARFFLMATRDDDPRDDDLRVQHLAALLSRAVTDLADVSAAVLTSLDLQSRILAALEARDPDEVVEEVSAELRKRRREALRELDRWTESLDSADPLN